MKTWPRPRVLGWSAVALFVIGIALLYAGLLKFAPLLILAAVVLAILAIIDLTAHDVARAVEQHHPADVEQ